MASHTGRFPRPPAGFSRHHMLLGKRASMRSHGRRCLPSSCLSSSLWKTRHPHLQAALGHASSKSHQVWGFRKNLLCFVFFFRFFHKFCETSTSSAPRRGPVRSGSVAPRQWTGPGSFSLASAMGPRRSWSWPAPGGGFEMVG